MTAVRNGYVDLFCAIRAAAKEAEESYRDRQRLYGGKMMQNELDDEVGPWQHFTDYWVDRPVMQKIWRLLDDGQRHERYRVKQWV